MSSTHFVPDITAMANEGNLSFVVVKGEPQPTVNEISFCSTDESSAFYDRSHVDTLQIEADGNDVS